jgi:hypothetical protein
MIKAVQLGCQAQRTMEAVQTWSSHFPRMAHLLVPVWIYVYVNALYEILSLVSTGSFLTLMTSFSRRFSCKYIFIYLCPGANYQYSWSPLFLQSFMVCLAVPSRFDIILMDVHIQVLPTAWHPHSLQFPCDLTPTPAKTCNFQPASLASDDNSRWIKTWADSCYGSNVW